MILLWSSGVIVSGGTAGDVGREIKKVSKVMRKVECNKAAQSFHQGMRYMMDSLQTQSVSMMNYIR